MRANNSYDANDSLAQSADGLGIPRQLRRFELLSTNAGSCNNTNSSGWRVI